MARKSIWLFSPDSAGKKDPTPATQLWRFEAESKKFAIAKRPARLDLGASLSVMEIEDHTPRLAVFSQMTGLQKGWL